MMIRIETRSTLRVFMVQDNKTINRSNVSKRLLVVPMNQMAAAIESGTEDS